VKSPPEAHKYPLCFRFRVAMQAFQRIFAAPFREVSEWSKEHAWKVCIAQKVIVGSNPILSANSFIPTVNQVFTVGILFFVN
jgi:hypothetical protein